MAGAAAVSRAERIAMGLSLTSLASVVLAAFGHWMPLAAWIASGATLLILDKGNRMASDPALEKIPDFYTDNATAMADMARLAGVAT